MNNNTVKYKNTNNDFVPQIPENWEFLKMRHIGNLYSGLGGKAGKDFQIETSKYRYVPFTSISNDIRVNLDKLAFVKMSEGEIQNQVNKDDILFLMSSETQEDIGKCAIVQEQIDNLFLNSFCKGFRISNEEVNANFLIYALNSLNYRNHFMIEGKGFTRINLKQFSIKNLAVALPPYDQQVAIANFLDEKCEQINQFIADKKQLINLLKEQRQSVIDKAVTRGINSNDELQESPVSFLPSFPKNWSLRRLGSIGTFSKGGNISRADLLFGVKDTNAILYGDIYTKYDIKVTEVVNQIKSSVAKNSIKLEYNDLLFTGSGETKEDIGKCIVNKCAEDVYAGGDVIIFKQNEFDSLFISYSQNSSFAKEQKAISSKGDIIVHQYGSKLKNVIMPFPAIEEQQKIVDFIIKETKTIDETIFKTEEELRLVAEYKEALISNAVTGQLHIA